MLELGQHYPSPPQDILRRLKLYDSRLHLNFETKMYCWQIWWRDDKTGQLEFAFNFLNEDGSYRELDNSIFIKLDECRWRATHPEEVQKMYVDDVLKKIQEEEAASHDNCKYISKDKSLRKRFEDVKEKIKSIPLKEWARKRYLKNSDGSVARDLHGNPVVWQPHSSLLK